MTNGKSDDKRERRDSLPPVLEEFAPLGTTIEPRLQTRTVEKKTFQFDPFTGILLWADGRKEPYALTVDGLVERPAQFTYGELLGFFQTEQVSDFHCVEGWSVLDQRWEGFRFEEILRRVTVKAGARYVLLHALGETDYVAQGLNHYIECLPLHDLIDARRQIILAMKLDGKPLDTARGAPLRLVSPFDLAYKSIKFVARIELVAEPQEGWWTIANPIYPMHAPVPRGRLRKK
jgi:DMSO/TMAO reductase YedYZ molybdopterin-dependent catalytic subunit